MGVRKWQLMLIYSTIYADIGVLPKNIESKKKRGFIQIPLKYKLTSIEVCMSSTYVRNLVTFTEQKKNEIFFLITEFNLPGIISQLENHFR